MNQDRRDRAAAIRAKLEEISAELNALHDEERDAFDNTPESLQQSEKGQASIAAADLFEESASNVDSAVSDLEGMIE
jgi:hypothetical protein